MASMLCVTMLAFPPSSSVAHSTLPELGDGDSAVLNPVVERRIGERIVAEARRTGQIYDDDALAEYLSNLGADLTTAAAAAALEAGVAPADFSFFPILDSTINAFALPGGFIGVHTGLMAAAQTESELASVLSHEIGHVTQRHIARSLNQQSSSSLAMLGALALAILAAASKSSSSADLAQAAVAFGTAGSIQQQLNFSRDAEREADRVGYQTLVRAGYDPRGMVDFFKRLQVASRLYEGNAPAYLRTHPLTVERIADIENRVRAEPYRQHLDRLDFFLMRARVEALNDGSVNGLREARGRLEARTRDGGNAPTHAAIAAWYGLAVVAQAQRDFGPALGAIEEARRRSAPNAYIESMRAEVLVSRAQAADAVAAMADALRRWPASALVRLGYARALQAAGDHARAVSYLREQTVLYRSDARWFELLARSYAAQGAVARQHLALAEVYRLQGALPAAVDQLEQAQRLTRASVAPDDFILASEVASRLRELRAQLADEMRERKKNADGG